jgi:membrane protein implicated in regulation of membrane protease activity
VHLVFSIALGIVLAVIILNFLPDILVAGFGLVLILIAIGLLILIGILLWQYPILLILTILSVLIACLYWAHISKSLVKKTEPQSLPQNEGKDANDIKARLSAFSSVAYEDTDHISIDQFSGHPENLSHPVAVQRASQLSSMLEFEIIDLIKRGYLRGVHNEGKWFFDLKETKKHLIRRCV